MNKEELYNKVTTLSDFDREFTSMVVSNKSKSDSKLTIPRSWITTIDNVSDHDCSIYFGIKLSLRDDKSKTVQLRLLGTGTLPPKVTCNDIHALIIKNLANVTTSSKEDFVTSIQCKLIMGKKIENVL